MLIEQILSKFEGVKQDGQNQWSALCPAHDDSKPSLRIMAASDKVMMNCMQGCNINDVLKAVEMVFRDLWFEDRKAAKPEIVATYNYRDEAGDLLYQVVRFEPKDFRQRQPKPGGGWIWNINGVRRVLYRLPEILKADPLWPVFVCEGEKDVDRLWKEGLVATCNAGGASKSESKSKWLADYSKQLAGRRVTILPDADEPGRAHARAAAKSLLGVAKSVRIIDLSTVGREALVNA